MRLKRLKSLLELSGKYNLGGAFMLRFQAKQVEQAERIKCNLRLHRVSDRRIREIVEEASQKSVTSFKPFLYWLDVLAAREVAGQCQADK